MKKNEITVDNASFRIRRKPTELETVEVLPKPKPRFFKRAGIFLMHIILAIFPTKEADIDVYFNKVMGYLNSSTVRSRLKITTGTYNAVVALIGGPRLPDGTPPNTNSTPETWNYVYPQATTDGISNSTLITEKDALVIEIKAAINKMYGDIPDNVIIPDDTKTLGIKPKSDRSARTLPPEIITTPVVSMESLGGEKIAAKFFKATGIKRASKINKKANIETVYSIIKIDGVSPATAGDCTDKVTLTKANSVLSFPGKSGYKIVSFSRWIYSKHPALSGGFGNAVTCIIT
jgi:hypothetical protein